MDAFMDAFMGDFSLDRRREGGLLALDAGMLTLAKDGRVALPRASQPRLGI